MVYETSSNSLTDVFIFHEALVALVIRRNVELVGEHPSAVEASRTDGRDLMICSRKGGKCISEIE